MDIVEETSPQPEDDDDSTSLADRLTTRYANFMVDHPFFNLFAVLVIVILAAILAFVKPIAQELPDFSEPTKGFEAWGTILSSRQNSLSRLKAVPGLSKNPPIPFIRKARSRRSEPLNLCQTSLKFYIGTMVTVYESSSKGSNLYTLENMLSICTLHNRLIEQNVKYQVARIIRRIGNESVPCPSYSLPNIIASRYKRQSCQYITQKDLESFSSLLIYCAKFYRSGTLAQCALRSKCSNIPKNCSKYPDRDQFYFIYHYLADKEFSANPTHLKLLLNVELLNDPWSSKTTEEVYKTIYKSSLKDLSKAAEGNVQLVAFDFHGLRFSLFNDRLLREASLIFLALVTVLIFIWIFSGSLFIATMTFACVIFALLLAYFIYGVIFRLSFFPFLNVTTLIFLAGIGADDAFVYVAAWNEAKQHIPYRPYQNYSYFLKRWTAYSLRHAIVAMFVTSSTTAGAFYATVTSNIIAIKCFSIYAGTSILTNYFLMVTLFPVVVIIQEKYLIACTHRCIPTICPPRKDHAYASSSRDEKMLQDGEIPTVPDERTESNKYLKTFGNLYNVTVSINRFGSAVFEEYLPRIVYKLRYFSIFIFLTLGVGGLVVIFYKPKLNLPLNQDFQMFSSASSVAQYSLKYEKKFSFHYASSGFYVDVVFLFGVEERDDRSPFNPDDKGTATLKPSFSISSKEEQMWLKRFCLELKNASFVRTRYISFCESYRTMWNQFGIPCDNPFAMNDPCCNLSEPTTPTVYDYCLRSFIRNASAMDGTMSFDSMGNIRLLKFSVPLKYEYRNSYEYNRMVFDTLETWTKPRMAKAPGGYRHGFWVHEMPFFDLQSALASGTQESIVIAVAIAFLVVLATTWNPLISFYAILSIMFVIAVTIATLVLAGWRLNVMESIVFSVAAGLSIDFTLHYGVAYQSSPDKTDRVKRVNHALRHIGAAVTMGGITTFVAGVAMAPASILAYIQMSHFLMLVMTVSWFYATFFFLPLCAVIGPTGDFCQYNCNRIKLFSRMKTKTQHAAEEVDLNGDEMGHQTLMQLVRSESAKASMIEKSV